MVKFLTRLPDFCVLKSSIKAFAHSPEAWLPLLDQCLFKSRNLAIKQETLAHPLGALRKRAVVVTLCKLKSVASHPDRSKLADESELVQCSQFRCRGIDMLHI